MAHQPTEWQAAVVIVALAIASTAAVAALWHRPPPPPAALLPAIAKADRLAPPVRVIPLVPQAAPLARVPEAVWATPLRPLPPPERPAVAADEPKIQDRIPPVAAPAEDPPISRHWHIGWSDRDVCTRHGLHKVITNRGRGWRCK
jgi:hypothetical protein